MRCWFFRLACGFVLSCCLHAVADAAGADIALVLSERGPAYEEQAQACEYGLFIGEAELLEDLAWRLREDDAVLTVRIADRDGCIWVQFGPSTQLPALDVASEGSLRRTRDILFISEPVRSRPLSLATDALGEAQPLTGLANRIEFGIQVHKALRSAIEEGRRHTLVCMNLDQFKVVNDTSGHQAGDELLRQLAAQIKQAMRSTDVFASPAPA